MARVLIQTLVFPPDGVSTADILGQLARELTRLGHQLTVVTTTPHYNEDASARAGQPLRRRAAGLFRQSDFHGVPVYHIPAGSGRQNPISRLLDYIRFHVGAFTLAAALRRRFDVILVVSPPPTAGFAAAATAALLRVPYVYNVQEVFPDALEHLGLLRQGGWTARVIAWAERIAYRRAASVVAVSDDFTRRLGERGAGERLRVIPNFAAVERLGPLPRETSTFAREHGLDDSFTVTYAGNLGLSQDWDAVLEAADQLVELTDLRFVIIGGGVESDRLRRRIGERSANNVLLIPYQPADRIAAIYAASDMCLVPMHEHLDFDTLPSKIYSIMASARAALVYGHPDSATGRLVRTVGCGFVVARTGGSALAAAIRSARSDRAELARMGQRGREYVLQHHTAQLVGRQYDELLRRVAP